jgi:hypothetical protein|tara:strand:+ start:208 stop:519 length:312 start_codon:yes stop_codon:yes gene_type:complete
MIEGFEHVGTDHKCNVCQCDFTDDEGGIQGYFGILPVAFCPTCYASMCDMVGQLDEREWDGLTDQEKDGKRVMENGLLFNTAEVQVWELAVQWAEDRLRERNS